MNHMVNFKNSWLATCLVAASICLAIAPADARSPVPTDVVSLDRVPANRWTSIYNDKPAIMLQHARFLWLPKQNQGFLWPSCRHQSRRYTFEQHAQLHFFSPADSSWTSLASQFPEGRKVYPYLVGNSYVHLPSTNKVLLLQPEFGARGSNKTRSWLLDLETRKWEVFENKLPFAHRSADYNPAAGHDGESVPLYTSLCYDGHNDEAVLIGGAGTWGRVTGNAEPVRVGDWIYDEASPTKRVRRILKSEKGKITTARRWYPAQVGTWTFQEKTRQWKPLSQPLHEQPSGRILPGVAYDPKAKKIVAFGGDNFVQCFAETWIYDCAAKTWKEAKPKVSPPPRAACAMVYVPDEKVILMSGGYSTGWMPLRDTWVYDIRKNAWSRLGVELPGDSKYVSADYDPKTKTVIASLSQSSLGRNRTTQLVALKLDISTARRADTIVKDAPRYEYHCQGTSWTTPLPERWRGKENPASEPAAERKKLAAMRANTWTIRKTPMKTRARQWGSYAYDPRTHKGFAWGGGHAGYIGAEMTAYDLLENRWKGMDDLVNYKVPWRHPAAGGIPGVSFHGWSLMGIHARRSYRVDPLSNSVITLHGDVYDIAEERFITNIGRCPGRYRVGDQVSFVTTPHGLYGYHSSGGGQLHRANVAAGKWNLVAGGGPKRHSEHNHLCYDSKRDRLIYFDVRNAKVTAFDFKTKAWAEQVATGKSPAIAVGDSTYIPELDAAMFICRQEKNAEPAMFFFNLAEKQWYVAPYVGTQFGSYGTMNNSTICDPELKLLVRIAHIDRSKMVEVLVMRLDPDSLDLKRLE